MRIKRGFSILMLITEFDSAEQIYTAAADVTFTAVEQQHIQTGVLPQELVFFVYYITLSGHCIVVCFDKKSNW